ncbi:MAG: hypothetical protein JW982_00590 [Spirochaetes bacterium]|nr:hypothetical protein [Spirochaetota bacterium]
MKVFYLKIFFSAAVLSAGVFIFSSELQKVIDDFYAGKTEPAAVEEKDEPVSPYPVYEYGDWEKYIHSETKPLYSTGNQADDENLLIEFKMPVNFSYGNSVFTRSKYKTDDNIQPSSPYVSDGYYNSMNYMLKVNGYVNDSLYLNIDHDSERENPDENIYEIIYNSPDPDSLLQQFKLGNIEVDFNKSQFAFYDNSSRRAVGFSTLLKKNNLTLEFFGIVNKNLSATDTFAGFKRNDSIKLREYQFVRRKFYQIEPFRRYDGRTSPPAIGTIAQRRALVAFTSDPVNAVPSRQMSQYELTAVNVLPGSLEVYLDDQTGNNNGNTVQFPSDNGYYDKLSEGVHYSINYATGEIEFHQPLNKQDRVVALYLLTDSTSTESVFPDYNGKKFVFIKYGENLSTINDDVAAHGYDVYEIRSRYFLGNTDIVPVSFTVLFADTDGTLQNSEREMIGKYRIDFRRGYLGFDLREPFKTNLDDADEIYLYSQTEISDMYKYSEFTIESTYNINTGNVKLSRIDIVPDSVFVKIDGSPVSASLYTVDYFTGEINFDENFVLSVSQNAYIEIKYQYKGSEENESSFVTGTRLDYRLNRNINLGASVLYSQDSSVYEIPEIDAAPSSNLAGEADVQLDYTAEDVTGLMKTVLNKKEFPFSYRGYCEYARSVMVVNTFGYGLIDDFDTPGSAVNVNIDDDDWILSSPPGGEIQSDRTRLFYKYYRDPDDGYNLKGDGFPAYDIDYSVKPGPYNISEKFQDSSGMSMVLDFDFNSADSFASVVTRRLDEQSADFSSLQYIEIIYRSGGGNGSVDLALDLGRINEDSDEDGLLDTEDNNGNGYLDYDPESQVFEDNGYLFNPFAEQPTYVGSGPRINYQTKGDGKLTSEDLNGNSLLDTAEDVITFPSTSATVNGVSGAAVLTVDMTDTSWKKVRIYLDRSSMTATELDDVLQILRKCEALRLYVSANNNAVDQGRIFINSINLVMLDWSELRIDGVKTDDPSRLKVSFVDTASDSEYRTYSFLSEEKNVYEELYGNADGSELNEGALEITYSGLTGLPPNGSVTRKFSKSLDLSNYDRMNLWINARSFTPGDSLEIIFGRNSHEYFVYSYNISSGGTWTQLELNLNDESQGGISCSSKTGNASLREINYFTVRINGNAGRLWINNIYVSKPRDVTGQAFYAENSFRSVRPLILHDNRKYLDNTGFRHVFKYVEGSFMSPERNDYGTEIVYNSFDFDTAPAEKMKTSFGYSHENRKENVSESQNNNLNFMYSYSHDEGILPDFIFKYRQNTSRSETDEIVSLSDYMLVNSENVYSFYTELFRNNAVIGGTGLSYHAAVGADYSRSEMARELVEGTGSDIELNTEYREQKNRYASGFEIINDAFQINADSTVSNSIINSYHGFSVMQGDPIQNEVSGKFYFPLYFDDNNYKLTSRNNVLKFGFDYKKPVFMNVKFLNSIDSSENSFADYSQNSVYRGKFTRERSLQTVLDSMLEVPFNFLDNRLGLKFSYEKKSSLSEENSPYEGEGENYFMEKYGAADGFSDLKTYQYNYADYYPFFFFSGSSFMLKGRQSCENIRNDAVKDDGVVFSEYDNSLSIKDTFTFSSEYQAGNYDASYSFGMTNLCQRENVSAVPGQNFNLDSSISVSLNLLKMSESANTEILNLDLVLSYSFLNYMLVTQNTVEYNHSPELSFIYNRKMYGFNFTASVIFRLREDHEFIRYGITDESDPDYIYSKNLSEAEFTENDRTYSAGATFFKKLDLNSVFPDLLKSEEFPVLTIDGDIVINDYDYDNAVSPEPYDKYSLKADLSYDVYKYVTVNFYGLSVLEKYYNRETGGLYKEVLSYEAGAGIQIIF